MIEAVFKKGIVSLNERDYQKLFSKGFGEKVEKLFTLNYFETLFLLENKKIKIEDFEFNTFLKKSKVDYKEYLVFKDLTKKGHNVKSGIRFGTTFRIYKKGTQIKKDHAQWLVDVKKYTSKLSLNDFASKNRIANTTNKKLLIAVVDLEDDITYFETSWFKP